MTGTLTAPRRSQSPESSARHAGARTAAAFRGRPVDGGPRLLLPPVAERPATAADDATARLALPGLRALASPRTARAWPALERPVDPGPTVLPDPDRLCGAVVVAAVEALRSARPLAQLARWVTPEVYESLERAARPANPSPRGRAVVRRVRLCRVTDTVAEGTVVVRDGDRARAAALRLEVHRGGWRVTVLQIG